MTAGKKARKKTRSEPARAIPWRLWSARFVFFYLASAIFVLSLPQPHKITNRARWTTAKTEREFEAWGKSLSFLGLEVSAQEVDAFLWPVAQAAGGAIEVLRAPFLPFLRTTGFFQSWRMFSTPNTTSVAWLVVELDRNGDGDFEVIHESRSSAHDWRSFQLGHDRMRKYIHAAVRGYEGKDFLRLSRWVATKAAVDFPEADAVRVVARYAMLEGPEQWLAGVPLEVEDRKARVFDLEPFRSGRP